MDEPVRWLFYLVVFIVLLVVPFKVLAHIQMVGEGDPDRERERRAIELAEKRARETARIEAHLADHDRHLDAINGSINQTAGEMRALGQQVNSLTGKFEQSLAVAAARASDAELAAKRQVTSRELYITAVGVVVALVSALAAGGVFG